MDDADKFPSQLAERFQVRLPDGMRDRLRIAADSNNRSMNAEIVARLEASFTAPEALNDVINNAFSDIKSSISEDIKKNVLKKLDISGDIKKFREHVMAYTALSMIEAIKENPDILKTELPSKDEMAALLKNIGA